MKKEIGIVKKTVCEFYDVVLKDGRCIRLTEQQIKAHNIMDKEILEGYSVIIEKQNKYSNGEWSKSYSTYEIFNIKKQ